MAKRKNSKRSDGRIAVQIFLGRDEYGKRKYKTVYGATQKEADEKAREIKLALSKGINVSAERDTFKDWADHWKSIKKTEVSRGRMVTYESCLKKLSALDNIPITKIRVADIQKIISSLEVTKGNKTESAAKKTRLGVRSTASQVFQMAIENRVIDFNPANGVKIPSDSPKSERRALTAEEQSWIRDTPHRAQRAAMIMMYSGLRRGELIPLTWSDIDLDKATISVNKTVEYINGRPEIKNTAKSEAGIRTVYIPQILVNFLSKQKKDSILVCPSASGGLMTSTAWKRLWDSYLLDLNLKYGDFSDYIGGHPSKFAPEKTPMRIPRFTAHWLRHTFITLMYFAGVDVMTAKEQAGHADIKTTMGIYTHLDKQFKQKSMSKLDDYINASHMQVNDSSETA